MLTSVSENRSASTYPEWVAFSYPYKEASVLGKKKKSIYSPEQFLTYGAQIPLEQRSVNPQTSVRKGSVYTVPRASRCS